MMHAADHEEREPPCAHPPERSSLDLAERDAHVRRLCAASRARLAADADEHPLTCGYYFAFAEDADAMCDCGLVARRTADGSVVSPRVTQPEIDAYIWGTNPARAPFRCRTPGVLHEQGDAATCPLWHETPGSYKPGDYGWRPPHPRTEACL